MLAKKATRLWGDLLLNWPGLLEAVQKAFPPRAPPRDLAPLLDGSTPDDTLLLTRPDNGNAASDPALAHLRRPPNLAAEVPEAPAPMT